jgi:predicted  nucleic acid-binding Zn ribbon protein
MHAPRQPTIRPCPLCGVAMQASKSREDLAKFDVFRCDTCRTTITETPQQPRPGDAT